MKQGTVKLLGAAALGAAFAATAAGTASAAGAASAAGPVTSAATGALQSVTHAAPTSDDGKGPKAEGNLLGGLPADGVTDAVGGSLPIGG